MAHPCVSLTIYLARMVYFDVLISTHEQEHGWDESKVEGENVMVLVAQEKW
jgi:hypothetical protein